MPNDDNKPSREQTMDSNANGEQHADATATD
jgi:hypothetical protein